MTNFPFLDKVNLQLGEKMSPAEVDKIFSSLDTNKDGKLDYGEFTGLYAITTKQLNHLLSVRGNIKIFLVHMLFFKGY